MSEKIKEEYTYTMPEAFMKDKDVPVRWRILGIVNGFHLNGRSFYGSNKWLMKRLGTSQQAITKAIKDLEDMGEVSCERTQTTRIIHRQVKGTTELVPPYKLDASNPTSQLVPNSISNSINKDIAKDAKAPPQPFIFEEALKKMEDSPRLDLQLIAYFIREKKLKFTNREQLAGCVSRHVRAAKQCVAFEKEKVLKAFKEVKELADRKPFDWTLDTVHKQLTK